MRLHEIIQQVGIARTLAESGLEVVHSVAGAIRLKKRDAEQIIGLTFFQVRDCLLRIPLSEQRGPEHAMRAIAGQYSAPVLC